MQQRTVENEKEYLFGGIEVRKLHCQKCALSMPYVIQGTKKMADDEHIHLLLGILCPPNYNPGVFPINDLNNI